MWAATPCPQAATSCVQVRVRFATEGELPDANGTLATGVETTPVRLSAGEIVVIAPSMSLEQGDVRTGRGDPCWNPPCRRTVLSVPSSGRSNTGRGPMPHPAGCSRMHPTLRPFLAQVAINGIDFVEGAVPIEYYFFLDPPRYLNLLEVEFLIYQGVLQGSFLLHFLLSWYFRQRYYRLYLRVKHWVKNRTVWRRARTYGEMEDETADTKKKKKSSSRT